MKLEYIVIGAIALIMLAIHSNQFAPSSLNPSTNFQLPITLHSDGHYYDANGVFVS